MNCCERKKTRAKVVQLLLELDFCWRNSASAKVYNFRWNCFFAAPPRSREAKPNWRERNRCSGVIIMSESVTRDAQRRVLGVVQGLLEGDKDSSPSVQNDRVFRLTVTGLEPLAARPIGASAKKHARKSCNFCWNWIFVGAIPRAQKSCNFCWMLFCGAPAEP